MKTTRAEAAASRSREAVTDELQQLLGDLEEFMRRLGEAGEPELTLLGNRIKALIASTREAIGDHAERPLQRARQAYTAGKTYVRNRPWQAAGVAGLLGVVIGILFIRR